MKFSVVIGNPPFKLLADNGRQTNLSIWKDFLVRSSELLEPRGYLAMITPTGWCSPSDSGKIAERVFTKKNLVFADISDHMRTHFPRVNSTFGYTITQNQPYGGATKLRTNTGTHTVDLRKTPVLTATGMSIMQRLTDNNLPRCAWQHARRAQQYPGTGYRTGTQPTTAIYPNIHHVNSSRDYLPGTKIPVRWSETPSALQGVAKVVIPYNGPVTVIVDSGTYGVGWCQVLLLRDCDLLESATVVFQSALFRWFAAQRYTQYNESKNLRVFPLVDLSQPWTPDTLLDFFGLNQEEREFLNSWSLGSR